MMNTPEWWPTLLADITAEHDDLDRIVSVIDEDEWLHPTPAEGWDVRDSIGHLAYFDDAARRAVVDPAGFAAHVEEVMSLSIDPIVEHLERGRSMNGAGVLAWWREAREKLLGCLSTADPESRLKWYGPPMGMRSFVTARLMETWAHGQDVVDALGVVRQPTARLRHIAELGVRTRNFSYIVRGLEPPLSEVAVYLEDPTEQGNTWHWGPDDASNSVHGTALDFCLIVTERRNLADVSLEIKGDDALEWMKIAQAFAGPPGPGRPPQSSV
ncbi:MAG: TIGR03084 family metal-binding protein [Actinobacteria bacterium]|nr:TIGR03084 family metal-binding protein [Actinomycetota bacterium]